jgi:hypothetical protein
MPAMINEAEIKDIPLSELPEAPSLDEAEKSPHEMPELPDLLPPEISASEKEEKEILPERQAERPRPQPFLRAEKPKPHWRSITFLSVLLAAILVGLFLWITRSPQEPAEPAPAAVRSEAPGPAPQKAVRSSADERTEPATAKEEGRAEEGEATPADLPAPRKKPAPEKVLSPEAEKRRPVAAAAAGEGQARKQFSAGDFRAAGEIWRQELIAGQVKFSVLLEMDCLKESVRIAYRQLEDKENFFLLNKTSRDGRSCYLVLWGRYRTADEAALGMKLVPAYFLKQSHPPSVIELEPYL